MTCQLSPVYSGIIVGQGADIGIRSAVNIGHLIRGLLSDMFPYFNISTFSQLKTYGILNGSLLSRGLLDRRKGGVRIERLGLE